MGLFDFLKGEKKYCDICGDEIKLLGNKKLADGNCCKKCAGKLSPWFSDRKHTTVEDIIKQIDYREDNEKQLDLFTISKVIGSKYNYKVYVDESSRKIIVSNKSSIKEGNPDIINLDTITSYSINIDEMKTEVHRKDKDGHIASYDPKQYNYRYHCEVTLKVDHPFIDHLSFTMGSSVYFENEYVDNNGIKNDEKQEEVIEISEAEYHKAKDIVEGDYPVEQKAEASRIIKLYERSGGTYIPQARAANKEAIPAYIPDLASSKEYQELLTIKAELEELLG